MEKGSLLLREEDDILLIKEHAVKMTSPIDGRKYLHQAIGTSSLNQVFVLILDFIKK